MFYLPIGFTYLKLLNKKYFNFLHNVFNENFNIYLIISIFNAYTSLISGVYAWQELRTWIWFWTWFWLWPLRRLTYIEYNNWYQMVVYLLKSFLFFFAYKTSTFELNIFESMHQKNIREEKSNRFQSKYSEVINSLIVINIYKYGFDTEK